MASPFLYSSELTLNYQEAYNDCLNALQSEITRARSLSSLDAETISFFQNVINALRYKPERITVFLPSERFQPAPNCQGVYPLHSVPPKLAK